MASSHHEVSILAPFLTIAIPDDPVPGVVNWVDAPSKDHDGVVEVLPSFTLVCKSGISEVMSFFALFGLNVLVEGLEALRGYQTAVVSGKDIWSLKFGIQWTVS